MSRYSRSLVRWGIAGLVLTSAVILPPTTQAQLATRLFGDGSVRVFCDGSVRNFCDGSVRGACDGSVRVLGSGPVRLTAGQTIRFSYLLPAVQKVRGVVIFVNQLGETVATRDLVPGGSSSTPFGDFAFNVGFDERGVPVLQDGQSTSELKNTEEVGILIGLLLPAVQKASDLDGRLRTGSAQVVSRQTGDIVAMLPYVEQDRCVWARVR